MTPRRSLLVVNAAWWALAALAAGVGLQWGDDLARWRALNQALDAVESCETDGDCGEAWARVQAIRGR